MKREAKTKIVWLLPFKYNHSHLSGFIMKVLETQTTKFSQQNFKSVLLKLNDIEMIKTEGLTVRIQKRRLFISVSSEN